VEIQEIEADIEQAYVRLTAAAQTARRAAELLSRNRLNEVIAESAGRLEQWQHTLDEHGQAVRWMTTAWHDLNGVDFTPAQVAPPPTYVRVGHVELDADNSLSIPAMVPLIGSGHLFISNDAEADHARGFLHQVLLRLLVATVPGSVQLILVDPLTQGQSFGPFLRLPASIRGDKVFWETSEIEQQIQKLAHVIEETLQQRLTNRFRSIEEYNSLTDGLNIPYRILVLSDWPENLSERARQSLDRIARNGPKAGVYVLASSSESDLSREIVSFGTTLIIDAKGDLRFGEAQFDPFQVIPDPIPEPEQVDRWLHAIGSAAQAESDSVPFRSLGAPESYRWMGNTADGIVVPIGLDSQGDVHLLALGKGLVHHGLIGGTRSLARRICCTY
jgi:hypothetical protein